MIALGLMTGCVVEDGDDYDICDDEESVQPAISTSIVPDFEMTAPLPVDPNSPWEDSDYKRLIQVWDCLDVSWWSDTSPKKVIQVFMDETDCSYYESVYIETWDCFSHEGADAPFRDWDEDGISQSEGDCDDEDPTTGGDLDNDGTSDCVDDDGDGLSEEEGDVDDRNPMVTTEDDTTTTGGDTGGPFGQ